jgi:DeoR family transcriptional regulator, glycerol-3-phosphate regulon repressor
MTRPLAVRRHDEIMRRLSASGSVSVAELAEALGVSHETVRRDLKLLSEQGQLDVVHGGAKRRGVAAPPLLGPASDLSGGDTSDALSRQAAALVPDGGSVLLDCGEAVAAIARVLTGHPGLTVFTNSLNQALLLSRVPGNRVFMLGGQVDPTESATFGIGTVADIDKLRVDIAFVTAAGFADDGALTDMCSVVAEVRGRMMLTGRAYVVAPRERLARGMPFRVPHFDKAAGIIVDGDPGEALLAAWGAAGLRLIAVDAREEGGEG